MAEVNTKVTSIVGRTEVTFKDKRTGADVTLPKYVVQTDDGKIYEWMTKATVEVGTEMKGTAETDTRSGMLRFQPTRSGGGNWGGSRGGGESNKQTAIKAAAQVFAGSKAKADEIAELANGLYAWLELADAQANKSDAPLIEPPADEIAKIDAKAAAEEMDL